MKMIGFIWGADLEAQKALVESVAARIGGELVHIHEKQDTVRNSTWAELERAYEAQFELHSDSLLIVSTLHGRNLSLSRNVNFLTALSMGHYFVVADTTLKTIADLDSGMPKPLSKKLIHDIIPYLTLASAAATTKALNAAKKWVAEESARRTLEMQKRKQRGDKIGAQNPTAANLTNEARQLGAEKTKQNAIDAYSDVTDIIHNMRAEGTTYRDIATFLNESGKRTRTGKEWGHVQVARVLKRGEAE